ncbi:hypothetical protein AXG93_4443s1050 [Marchantia polymorpha subsp. ruderalis]|uniref:Dirigent protein n=1 Tax=Marchantia polymorpha subsp. ruderalis TaxID=1480154 RepID=A0A176VX32_MARPO|nr:hypothetical protein AXG93_4443s1050 [Marchantia polymorpha subsp. ruderalis]
MRSPRLVIVVLSILQLFQCTKEVGAAGPANLILYAHESRVPPTQTLIGSAAPNGNLTDEQFGLIKTVSNVLRAGKNNDSMVVGSQVGIVVLGKDVLNIYISYTYFLNNDSGFGGSTIAVHGHIDATSMGNRVFAVVGGTDLELRQNLDLTATASGYATMEIVGEAELQKSLCMMSEKTGVTEVMFADSLTIEAEIIKYWWGPEKCEQTDPYSVG